jgi:hypothetical protein
LMSWPLWNLRDSVQSSFKGTVSEAAKKQRIFGAAETERLRSSKSGDGRSSQIQLYSSNRFDRLWTIEFETKEAFLLIIWGIYSIFSAERFRSKRQNWFHRKPFKRHWLNGFSFVQNEVCLFNDSNVNALFFCSFFRNFNCTFVKFPSNFGSSQFLK